MNYQIGYKPTNRRYIQGESVLNRIKYSKLRVLGAGANGIVMTDGKYAIKVGYIRGEEPNELNTAAKYGFAIPVVFSARSIRLDPRIVKVLRTSEIKRDGHPVKLEYYLSDDDIAGIMVSFVGQPYFDNSCSVSSEERDRGYQLARKVRDKYMGVSQEYWGDCHPWNLGIYRGAIVILDY